MFDWLLFFSTFKLMLVQISLKISWKCTEKNMQNQIKQSKKPKICIYQLLTLYVVSNMKHQMGKQHLINVYYRS